MSEQSGGLSLKEQANEKKEHIKEKLSENPLVSAVLKTFSGAQIDGFKMPDKNETDENEAVDELTE